MAAMAIFLFFVLLFTALVLIWSGDELMVRGMS
jgi:hypothetical protein